jgi:hypothetical protein
MRTTLNIDDDVLQAAKELGRRRHETAGKVISSLARKSLGSRSDPNGMVREPEEFYGFKPLPKAQGKIVTNALIDRLREASL